MAVNRIVVFGGTFDPVHVGHIAIARSLSHELEAEVVIMVPTGRPWLRAEPPVASPEDRLRMLELATENEPGIDVSDVDVVRDKTTYSIDTIRDLRRVYGEDCEYLLAIGSDAAAELHRWHRYEELTRACKFAVVHRPGMSIDNGTALPDGTLLVRGPMVDVSASQIRSMYSQSDLAAAANLVPDLTHRFIIEKGLYRCTTPKP